MTGTREKERGIRDIVVTQGIVSAIRLTIATFASLLFHRR